MAGRVKAPAARPRSGFVREDQRHTVRVRVSREHAEALAARWGVKVEDAVRRAVEEAAAMNRATQRHGEGEP